MSNKKKRPAAGKSVAGKTNSGKNAPKQNAKLKEKQKAEAQRQAQRVAAERDKAQRERARRSEEIRKRRAKQTEKTQKAEKKLEHREKRADERQNFAASVRKTADRAKYYVSKEFLGSFNYKRIFIFIVLPVAALCLAIALFMQTPLVNVPVEIRQLGYNGRVETSAEATALSESQQELLVHELGAKGSGRFEFYLKPEIRFEGGETSGLCFGNPNENCVLVATIFNGEGEVLYRSLGLESGKELNMARLFKAVPFGKHEVTVAVNAYNPETNEKIGTKYADIILNSAE